MSSTLPLNRILVIDEVPVIAPGLHQTFSLLNPAVTTTYCDDLFRALSAAMYKNMAFDLVVLGTLPDSIVENLPGLLADLKAQFNRPKVMLYVAAYDHTIIENRQTWGIDACVHRFEPIQEIQNAYTRLAQHESYLSDILHTLFNDYQLKTTSVVA
jgi:DNA-binding NarL/FixJ family response regulator